MSRKTTYDAGSIAVLEGLEAVRVRPGMYIGSVSTKGLNHLLIPAVSTIKLSFTFIFSRISFSTAIARSGQLQ